MENQMSDNQRRLFCRLLFLFFCLLPTAIIVYRACHPRTPVWWQQQVFTAVGIHTRVNSVETLSPQETVLRDVTIFDGHGQPILSAMEVDLSVASGHSQIVIRDQIRLSNHGLKYLAETVNRRMMKSGPCSVLLNDVVLVSTEGGQTRELRVTPIEITTSPTAEGGRAIVTLRMKHTGGFGPQQLDPLEQPAHSIVQCSFDHITETDQIRIHVETNRVAMPCWLADQWLPELQELGTAAGFAGRFFIEPQSDGLHGWVDGQFTDVDLKQQLARELPERDLTDPSDLDDSPERMLGQIELRTSFPLLPKSGVSSGRDEDYAILKLPDGTSQPILPDYEMQQVFDVRSAISNTVRTARSRSAINF